MCIDKLLKDNGWELVIWNSTYDGVCAMIGPNLTILNYIKECSNIANTNILDYLNKHEDIPFITAEDVNTAISDLEMKLDYCDIEKCIWRDKVADTICAVGVLFGYMD